MLRLEVAKIYNPNLYRPARVEGSERFGVTVRVCDLPSEHRERLERKYPVYSGFVQTNGESFDYSKPQSERNKLMRLTASHAPEIDFKVYKAGGWKTKEEVAKAFHVTRRDWIEAMHFADACNKSRDQVFTESHHLTYILHVEEWQHPINQTPLITLRKVSVKLEY